jgi:hypothetical protein
LYDKAVQYDNQILQINNEVRVRLYCNINDTDPNINKPSILKWVVNFFWPPAPTPSPEPPMSEQIDKLISNLIQDTFLTEKQPNILNIYSTILSKTNITDKTYYTKMKPYKSNTINIDLPLSSINQHC